MSLITNINTTFDNLQDLISITRYKCMFKPVIPCTSEDDTDFMTDMFRLDILIHICENEWNKNKPIDFRALHAEIASEEPTPFTTVLLMIDTALISKMGYDFQIAINDFCDRHSVHYGTIQRFNLHNIVTLCQFSSEARRQLFADFKARLTYKNDLFKAICFPGDYYISQPNRLY